ncbi:glycine betaine ABC transporter substrate-binding protein [Tepidibacillus decaturensis]|nr:glycine betaine ABC transporter substrate-binding protein [Tepidibacillus decaturensis]
MNMKKVGVFLLISVLSLGLVLSGCSSTPTSEDQIAKNEQKAKRKVTLSYVAWASEIASTNVVKTILEDKLGYEVDMKQVNPGAMYNSVASGEADATVAAWLPTTQKALYEKHKDKLENLGPNLEGTIIGLVVPKYVDINSIEDLNENKDKFNGDIVGIDAGAGIMATTDIAIEKYGLDLNLRSSSDAAMTAALDRAYKNNEWIVVTGWTPHWMFAKYDLKYLEDPKGIYGEAEEIDTLVRKGLKEDDPTLYNFFDQFYWEPSDMEQVMGWIQDGMDETEAAKKWVEENEEKIKAWLSAE